MQTVERAEKLVRGKAGPSRRTAAVPPEANAASLSRGGEGGAHYKNEFVSEYFSPKRSIMSILRTNPARRRSIPGGLRQRECALRFLRGRILAPLRCASPFPGSREHFQKVYNFGAVSSDFFDVSGSPPEEALSVSSRALMSAKS